MNLWLSYLKLTLAQAIIGLNFVMAKILMPYFPINLLCYLRFTLGALIMGALCYFHRLNPQLDDHGHHLKRADWMLLLVQGLCAGFLFNILVLAGLQYTQASTAGIISSTTPAAIAVMSYFILKEKLGFQRIFSIALAIVGVVVISIGQSGELPKENSYFGDFLVLLAVLPEALFTVIAKWYKKSINPYNIAFILCAMNSLMFLPLALSSLKTFSVPTEWSIWLLFVIYGTLGSAGFFLLWYQGLAKVPASLAGLFTAVMPISATILGYVILYEAVTWFDLLGITLVMISIVYGSLSFKAGKSKTILFND